MRTIALGAAIAATLLAGCTAPSGINTYSYAYKSEQHSGNVEVTETIIDSKYSDDCRSDWRGGKQFVKRGVDNLAAYNIAIDIRAAVVGEGTKDISISVPSTVGHEVLMRDFQKSRSFMLAPDSNGIMKQGDEFYYPEGFVVRASNPSFEGDSLNLCLGIDRMYVPAADLQSSSDPTIRLDRLMVPFTAKVGIPQTFSYGSKEPITVTIMARPK